MFFKFTAAFFLLGLTVLINTAGLSLLLHRIHVSKLAHTGRIWSSIWLLIRLASWVVAIHVVGISVWAAFYWWQHCLPDFESSFYFSIVTYTTVGYGDVVLARDWRLFAGLEALTGILMCGLSTGYFFAIVSQLYALRPRREE